MNKEEISKAEELVAKRQRLGMKRHLLSAKIENIDAMIARLESDKLSLINQKNLILRTDAKVLMELASIIHRETCYTCNNEKCRVKHGTFSPKCDKYGDELPF